MTNQKYEIPNVTLNKEGEGRYKFSSLDGVVELPSWKDFQRKFGQYATLENNDDYKRISLRIGGDEVIENPVITKEHVTGYDYLLQNQTRIQESMLDALFIEYPKLKEQYNHDDDEKELMPDVKNIKSFTGLIELSSVYILNVSKEGVPYIGFSFWCTWDDEHGLGIMTHKDRIVEIGGSDTAFLTWIAQKDLSPKTVNSEPELKRQFTEEKLNPVKPNKHKPWWKFW